MGRNPRRAGAVLWTAGMWTLLPAALPGQGRITGVVLDSLGSALSGAQVTLDTAKSAVLTNASGEFRFSRVPLGSFELRFRRLGYRPEIRIVQVESGKEVRIDVRLAALPLRLPTVEVRRRVEAYDSRLAGFNARRERRVGHYVTREQLDRLSSARFVDALRDVPGVQLRPIRGGGTTLVLRGSRCPPLVFIDGFPIDAGVMDLDMIDLASVEGIEVYSGVASVPAEFMGARGGHGCGVVAIWSRPTRPRKQRVSQMAEIDLEKLLALRSVYTSDQVDRPAALSGGEAIPVYPDSLWRAGTPGRVVAEFVVDTGGNIETGSLHIVSTTHPHFASAVKVALAEAAFRPAVLKGQPVRQIVQLPFVFSAEARDSIPPPSR